MEPFDLKNLKTYPLASRPSKVVVGDLGRPVAATTPIGDWIDTLPKQFAANELRKLREHIVRCHREKRTVAAATLRARNSLANERSAMSLRWSISSRRLCACIRPFKSSPEQSRVTLRYIVLISMRTGAQAYA